MEMNSNIVFRNIFFIILIFLGVSGNWVYGKPEMPGDIEFEVAQVEKNTGVLMFRVKLFNTGHFEQGSLILKQIATKNNEEVVVMKQEIWKGRGDDSFSLELLVESDKSNRRMRYFQLEFVRLTDGVIPSRNTLDMFVYTDKDNNVTTGTTARNVQIRSIISEIENRGLKEPRDYEGIVEFEKSLRLSAPDLLLRWEGIHNAVEGSY